MEITEFFEHFKNVYFINDLPVINEHNQYKGQGGVWALFGRKKDQKKWVCLQVAKTVNIGKEIAADIHCMKDIICTGKEKKYINQFGKFMFSYHKNDHVRGIEYSMIKNSYKDLLFICVCSDEKDDKKKRQIEKYFAWKMQALYWRNGRPYKSQKNYSKEYLQKVSDNLCLEDKVIKKHIDDFIRNFENIGTIDY